MRELLLRQHPDLAGQPIVAVASGWDNAIFRLGSQLAIRLPRRELAATLVAHEQRWLAHIQSLVPLRIPVPTRVGVGQDSYPWAWSIVPWFDGETADLAPPAPGQEQILGRFLSALHRPAPADAPTNPYRGVPLAARAEAVAARMTRLAARTTLIDERIQSIWRAALAAPADASPTWIHGDLHPRNVLVTGGQIHAVIDWGDLTRGDRATDLASVWMLLGNADARDAAMRACVDVSEATWLRARGWAVFFSVVLLDTGLADDPRMTRIAERTIRNLLAGP